MSAKRFREYVDECMGWTKTASSDKNRQNYLQMAETWLRAADHYETARPVRHRHEASERPSAPQKGLWVRWECWPLSAA